ncbi:hypothetical protein [Micromonospora thermarum]|uniref:Uncharacterized protein n=1 Tax=Micromonospora thermarum TaxID=2720024 RepID=A0ABX0ZB48_9ACTN|nr:hypothetical protein [Micromonospora thermarum]NJP33694.1 hypothetical protein [Micromonospora thermarum]
MDDELMTASEVPARVAEAPPRPRGARLNNAMELAGYLCLVAFGYAVWPPAALLVAGVVLVVTSNARAAAAKPKRRPTVHWTERLARALAAYRAGSRT